MERLSSYFHPIETGDARTFLSGAIDLFARYPQEVIEQSLDVSIGLPGKYKFWPRISEIKEVLDDLNRPVQFKKQWDKQATEQITERLRLEAMHRPVLTEDTAHKLFMPPDRMGLSQAEWDALPNQPENFKRLPAPSTDPPSEESAA